MVFQLTRAASEKRKCGKEHVWQALYLYWGVFEFFRYRLFLQRLPAIAVLWSSHYTFCCASWKEKCNISLISLSVVACFIFTKQYNKLHFTRAPSRPLFKAILCEEVMYVCVLSSSVVSVLFAGQAFLSIFVSNFFRHVKWRRFCYILWIIEQFYMKNLVLVRISWVQLRSENILII